MLRSRLSCSRSISRLYGAQNHFMFVAHLSRKVGSARFVRARDTGGAAQELAQIFQRANQEGVARSVRDGAVVLNVLVHTIATGLYRLVKQGY